MPDFRHRRGDLVARILVQTASFALLQQLDLRMIWAALDHHLDRCNLTLRILQTRSVRRSWEIEIDVHCDDNLHHGCGSDFEENRNGGCGEGCESGVLVNEIFPSVAC